MLTQVKNHCGYPSVSLFKMVLRQSLNQNDCRPRSFQLRKLSLIICENKVFGKASNVEGDSVTIINIQSARTNVASYSSDFMIYVIRNAVEAQLMAKANIVESISSDAKALRSVVKFSNPVMKQIAQKESVYRQAIAVQKRQVESKRCFLLSKG